MGKGTILVVVYSLILLALFSTFSYLMTTVDPSPMKPNSNRLKKFESVNEEILYPNEILQPNDNVAYGLEKVDYDSIEVYNKMTNFSEYRKSELPKRDEGKSDTSKPSKKSKKHKTTSNSSRTENKKHKMATVKKKFAKGFRRSIREKPNVLNSKLLSLLLNIKLFNGQPRIEIKVLDSKNEENTKNNEAFPNKMKKLNISGVDDNDVVRELQENDTLLFQVVGNLNETCDLNISNSSCKGKRESMSELIVEIVNSSESSDNHVLALPNSTKDVNVTSKNEQYLEIKEKYKIEVASAMPSKLNNFNGS